MSQPIKCLIVDDEPLAIEVLKEYISQIPQLIVVDSCHSALKAFQIMNQQKIDLILLDIEMPELNGLDFIKSLSTPPAVILTTAYREYAFESYEIKVIDYLLKPISFPRFFKAINKYLKLNTDETKTTTASVAGPVGSIYVYSEKKNVKVYFDEILYIESIKDYVRIHTATKNIISKDTISRYENLLPVAFFRIHRSFIVNSSKITAFTHHDIEIGKKELPIGASYKKAVLAKLKV